MTRREKVRSMAEECVARMEFTTRQGDSFPLQYSKAIEAITVAVENVIIEAILIERESIARHFDRRASTAIRTPFPDFSAACLWTYAAVEVRDPTREIAP